MAAVSYALIQMYAQKDENSGTCSRCKLAVALVITATIYIAGISIVILRLATDSKTIPDYCYLAVCFGLLLGELLAWISFLCRYLNRCCGDSATVTKEHKSKKLYQRFSKEPKVKATKNGYEQTSDDCSNSFLETELQVV